MSNTSPEQAELKALVADLKSDRAAQKEKEQREGWTRYTAVSLVFIAVLAAIASQWSGKYGSRVLAKLNDSTFHQAEASDQWAYYQAKSIKQSLQEQARDELSRSGTNPADLAEADRKIRGKIDKYEQEKKEIEGKARELERERDNDRVEAKRIGDKGGGMGQAVAIFQLAIAFGSLCLLTKRKPFWYFALGLAGVATVLMGQVWLK